MNLNQGQQQAADAFFDFLLDPTRKELCISGPAGVGKTFFAEKVAEEIGISQAQVSRLEKNALKYMKNYLRP